MNLYRTFSRWLKAPLYDPVKIPARASWPTDPELERRQCLARETLKAAGTKIKADRVEKRA